MRVVGQVPVGTAAVSSGQSRKTSAGGSRWEAEVRWRRQVQRTNATGWIAFGLLGAIIIFGAVRGSGEGRRRAPLENLVHRLLARDFQEVLLVRQCIEQLERPYVLRVTPSVSRTRQPKATQSRARVPT